VKLVAGALLLSVLAAPDAAVRLPEPGTYELPPIARVGDFALLDSTGRSAPLLGLGQGQLALVALVYSSCPSVCPAALSVLQGVDREVAIAPDLRSRVRLVTLSFDPATDTPERMAELRERFAPRADWRFLTAKDEAAIRPVLDAFDQDTLRLHRAEEDGEERDTPWIRHVLKVFLVDDRGDVRNIYSAGLFSKELVLADLRTLLLESRP